MSSISRPILKDTNLEYDLRRDGIATFDFLNEQEFEDFRQIVEELGAEGDHDDVHLCTPFRLSAFNNSYDWKSHIYERVYTFLKAKMEALLENYEPLVINIFEKLPHTGDNSVAIHQNPSFVEEPDYKSVSLWIPMINVRRENGTLGVLKGSHDVFDAKRAANMPDVFASVATQLQNDWFEPLELKTGQAALLDDGVIHWSYPNITDENRVAVQLICVPRDTRHIYYYYDESSANDTRLNLYEVTKDFFFKFNCKAEPQGLWQFDSQPYRYKNLTPVDLFDKVGPRNEVFAAKRPIQKSAWWQRLLGVANS